MANLSIAIAGAGVGGLAAALALHRMGHRITIYEQFSAPRPLGSGLILQPTGLAVLDWLGLGERIRSLGARIDRLVGTASSSGKMVLDVRYAALGEARGYAVHRAALFNVLHDAVLASGIPIETSRRINGFDDGVLLLVEGGRSPRFDLVIDALGARSPLKSDTVQGVTEQQLAYGAIWASLPWPGVPFDPHALAQKYHQASIMVGVLPIGFMHEGGHPQAAFFWSLKDKDYETWKANGLDAWKHEILRYWPETETLLKNIQCTDDLVLARYQHHTLRTPYAHRLICIGDSAHSTSPQLGQGANMALLDVMALHHAMAEHDDLAQAAAAYTALRKWHVLAYQTLSRMFTPFYQSDSRVLPWMRDVVVSNVAQFPPAQRFLARMVAGTIIAPISSRKKDLRRRDAVHSKRGQTTF